MSRATTDPDIRTVVVALIFSSPPFAFRFNARMSSNDCACADAVNMQTASAVSGKRKRRMKTVSLEQARQVDCDMNPYVRRRTFSRSRACVSCLLSRKDAGSDPAAGQHSVQRQENNGAENGHDP